MAMLNNQRVYILLYILATAPPGLRIHLALIEPILRGWSDGEVWLLTPMAWPSMAIHGHPWPPWPPRESAEEQKYSANLDSCQVPRRAWALPGQLPDTGLPAWSARQSFRSMSLHPLVNCGFRINTAFSFSCQNGHDVWCIKCTTQSKINSQ